MVEIWKDIKGYKGKYQISNFGKVKSLARKTSHGHKLQERNLKLIPSQYGYLMVNLSNIKKKTHIVHKLVAIAFLNHVPCGHKLVIDHKDFNRINNHLSNLKIISQRENTNRKHLKSSSIYVGVCRDKSGKKWQASIRINGRLKHLGLFTDELKASKAYQIALNRTINYL